MTANQVQLQIHAWWSVTILLTSPLVGYDNGHNCGSEASVTYIHVGFSHTTTDVHASQLQPIQTYLLVRCISNRHACWLSLIVTDVPGGLVQL